MRSSRWPRWRCRVVCSPGFWSGYGGCDRPRRCRDDDGNRRDSQGSRRQRGWFAQIADGRPHARRFGQHHGLAAAGYPLHRADKVLADLGIGVRIVRKADGGRQPKSIREIPDQSRQASMTGAWMSCERSASDTPLQPPTGTLGLPASVGSRALGEGVGAKRASKCPSCRGQIQVTGVAAGLRPASSTRYVISLSPSTYLPGQGLGGKRCERCLLLA